MKEPTRGILK